MVGLIAVAQAPLTQAADHADSPSVKMAANAMADLNDVYAWMNTDGTKVNLALTVSPFDDLAGGRSFGPTVAYVFHLSSRPAIAMPGVESKIVCTFVSDTDAQCWVVDPQGKTVDYVRGDLSGPNGRISDSRKFRVFAGRRSDPFFFNFGGFRKAVTAAITKCAGNCPGGTAPGDAAGCLQIDKPTGDAIRTAISTISATNDANTPCDDTADIDCFISANVMAIVVQIDKTELLNGSDAILSVWASTHAGS